MTTQVTTSKPPSAWRRWRKARPFSGGLLVTLAGIEILFVVRAPLPVVMHVGMQGMIGYLIPILLLLCGVLLLFNPAQRLFYSTIAAVFALASWATSNLGGFVIGLLLGLVGSALAFAWTPNRKRKQPRAVTEPVEESPTAESSAEEMFTREMFTREHSTEEPAEKSVEEPAAELAEEPATEPAEHPAAELAEHPAAELAEEPAEEAEATGRHHHPAR